MFLMYGTTVNVDDNHIYPAWKYTKLTLPEHIYKADIVLDIICKFKYAQKSK